MKSGLKVNIVCQLTLILFSTVKIYWFVLCELCVESIFISVSNGKHCGNDIVYIHINNIRNMENGIFFEIIVK